MTGAATVIAPSLLGMLAYPRAARATLAPDIQTAVTACSITTGAGMIPFICFDLAGGGNIAGSNVLVGGPERTARFPDRSPATANWGCRAPWCRTPAPPEISSTRASGCAITRTARICAA